MNIHEQVREQVELANTYARDGAFFSAAQVLEAAARLYHNHGLACDLKEIKEACQEDADVDLSHTEVALTPLLVKETWLSMLWPDDSPLTDEEKLERGVRVEGIAHNHCFDPDRVKEKEQQVASLLNQLPDPFHEKVGGGWSFLNMCNDKHGKLWTGDHMIMETLMVMGIATGKVAYLISREMWSVLPGGMPYIVVKA